LQYELAEQLGVHVESLKNWERGVGSPSIRQLPRIISFLGYDPEPEPATVGGKIAFSRRRLGLTQENLAKTLGIDPVTVYRWERGLSAPTYSKLAIIRSLLPADSKLILR
jgi:transcriptional regulator with XRE-family HTH domain